MLSSETTCKLERSFHRDDNRAGDDPLAAYFEAANGAFSRNTERALRADVQVFAAWCRQHFEEAFPAKPATLVAFVDDMGRIKTPATVRRYVSSIATLHKALRQPNPFDSAAVRFALQRMHRRRGRRQAQVQGLTWPLRNRLLEATGDRLIDARNRALLAVGYDTLLRRSELVSLQVPDLLEDIDGTATLLVRAGKTDGDGRGAMLYLARDTVQLVKAWLELAGCRGRAAVPFGAQGRHGGREARREPDTSHLQADGPAGGAALRYRGHPRGGCGREPGCPGPPAQIRTCALTHTAPTLGG